MQVVANSGPVTAKIMIAGEQPGEHGDLYGRPFFGPAGQVLNDAPLKAEIDCGDLYLTNAV